MKKSIEVKERIIEAALALLQESNGYSAEITTRDIAEKAQVGNGLINYHFQTKENLITICVQRIIGQVVDGFEPNAPKSQSVQERMTDAASIVFEFLFANPSISRISILGDLSEPEKENNTVKSQHSVHRVLGESMREPDKKIFSFVLVSAMQTAFLANQCGEAIVGCQLDSTESRKAFIDRLVELLLHGIGVKKNI